MKRDSRDTLKPGGFISGKKLAGYLRQIADALEPSKKGFTAKIKITISEKPARRKGGS